MQQPGFTELLTNVLAVRLFALFGKHNFSQNNEPCERQTVRFFLIVEQCEQVWTVHRVDPTEQVDPTVLDAKHLSLERVY